MVRVSMDGSSASYPYGSGGNVNGTCCSSTLGLDCIGDLLGVAESKNSAAERRAVRIAAPAAPVPSRNFLRFMRKTSRGICWPRNNIGIITLRRGRPQCRLDAEPRRAWRKTLNSLDARECPLGVFGYEGIFGRGKILQALDDFGMGR